MINHNIFGETADYCKYNAETDVINSVRLLPLYFLISLKPSHDHGIKWNWMQSLACQNISVAAQLLGVWNKNHFFIGRTEKSGSLSEQR